MKWLKRLRPDGPSQHTSERVDDVAKRTDQAVEKAERTIRVLELRREAIRKSKDG